MKAILKKVLSFALVIALTAGVAIGGTLAYLTQDVGEKQNVLSIGNIDIELTEEVGVFGEGGTVKETVDGAKYDTVMPGDYLKKEVTVTNNGTTDAYVAVTVTLNNAKEINAAIDETYGDENAQAMYDFIFDGWGMKHTKDLDGDGVNDAGMRLTITGEDMPEHVLHVDSVKTIDEYALFYTGNWFGEQSDVIPFNGYYTDGMETYEFKYTYYAFLPAGETTTLFKGLNVPAEFTNEQMAMFDGLEINVEAKAIQADNMAIAKEYKDDTTYGKAKTAFAILHEDIEVPEYSNKPSGKMGTAYTSATSFWGEHSSNAKVSHVIKFYSGNTYMGSTSLKNIDNIIDGDVYVTWNIKLDADSNADGYWSMDWEVAPSIEMQPDRVELWVDGEKVDEGEVQLNGPDNLNPINAVVVDENGKILRYVVKGTDANLQDGETYVGFISSDAELSSAIAGSEKNFILTEGTYHMPASAKNKTLTITGTGNTIIEVVPAGQGEAGGQLDYNLDSSTVTFNNLTIKTNNNTYAGYARLSATYNNCTFDGHYSLQLDSVFNDCVFNVSGDQYNIWTWGAPNATFNGCTFNSDGKAVMLYGTADTKLTINECVFNDNGGLTDLKAAIEIGNDYNKSYELIVNKTVVNGYEINDKGINTGTTLWANKNSMSTDKLNVIVDGVDVY